MLARVGGRLDRTLPDALEPLIERVEATGARRVVLDLGQVTGIDSDGLPALIQLGEGLRARGGGLALVETPPAVARICRLVLEGGFFVLALDLPAALEAIPLRPVRRLRPPADPFSPRAIEPDFQVVIRAGAVMPTGRQETLRFEGSGRVIYRRERGEQPPVERPFYGSDQLLSFAAAWVESLLETDPPRADPAAARVVDGDYLSVEATHGGRAWRGTVRNAYDPVVCELVEVLQGALPEEYHVIYSSLEATRLRLRR